jgi:separase
MAAGAQFVRSKTVKRLYQGYTEADPKATCATAFLFGCSSAHLSENGIYEPSGMLAAYLAAGAPAVVGMLWDVTDKDCDRFAVKAGELWGLWPELKPEAVGERSSKGKGKVAQVVAEVENVRSAGAGRRGKKAVAEDSGESINLVGAEEAKACRGVGLDEAVRDARGACVLRYLNGAAAVVYGIPVYLE